MWLLILIDFLWDLSAINIIKAIKIEIKPIEKLERNNESENWGKNNLIMPPIQTIGMVLIQIELNNCGGNEKL